MSILTTPVYRANVTDKEQSDIESQEFDSIPVFVNGETKGITAGSESGAAISSIMRNQCQIMSYSDNYQRFMSDLVGRA